jgi:hypothetical protein
MSNFSKFVIKISNLGLFQNPVDMALVRDLFFLLVYSPAYLRNFRYSLMHLDIADDHDLALGICSAQGYYGARGFLNYANDIPKSGIC